MVDGRRSLRAIGAVGDLLGRVLRLHPAPAGARHGQKRKGPAMGILIVVLVVLAIIALLVFIFGRR
jgi:hypothetical protein